MNMEARWNELLGQDITKGLKMEISEKELLGEPTACEIAASPVTASVTVKELEVFCKSNTDDTKYLDSCAERCGEVIEPVCKTTGVDSCSDFLRHVEWSSTQPFGKCTPVLDKGGQHIDIQQPRRPVRERLGRQYIAVNHIRHPEVDELENLER